MTRLAKLLFNSRPIFIYIFQATLVFVSLVLGWLLRFNFALPYRHMLLTSGFLLIAVRLLVLRFFKLNHGWWHFASVSDVLNILKAVFSGSLAFFVLNRYLFSVVSFPRSIYFLEAILTVGLLAGARLASRVVAESARGDSSRLKRVMLVGAGFAAQMVIRELARADSGYRVVGCVDDDLSKRDLRIHGVPVLGGVEELKSVVEMSPVDEILITIPSASGKQMRRLVEVCQKTRLPFKTVPTLRDFMRGEAMVSQVRDVHGPICSCNGCSWIDRIGAVPSDSRFPTRTASLPRSE
jgi:FlaA1/EpsC-like NDP-sugar epimerase